MMHLVPSSSDTLPCCDSRVQNRGMKFKINFLPSPAAHLEVTGRPLSPPRPQPQPPQFILGRRGGSRTPPCGTPSWPQPPYLPAG